MAELPRARSCTGLLLLLKLLPEKVGLAPAIVCLLVIPLNY